ncbi:hypothetical protein [Alkalimarinus alittae]|uniref:siroheme decarboxylase n=1 Tax=Alkalimarinus alittae TaxID=2961619 RepID=A0ABY6N672_9ALTE|nr:hypothetical protein [Alkalimarinus alittae]UZE97515.1 hypothetical protein NKI27_07160 [Alkalimarinus alittae]
MSIITVDSLGQQIIDRYQKGFPLSASPFKDIADELGVQEQDVLDTIQSLQESQVVSRLGPVFNHEKVGASTLAAISVPEALLGEAAELVNSFDEVNHNYAREHAYNLWFVVTATDQQHLDKTLQAIETKTGYPILNLPMEQAYHIDLGFKLNWS